MKKLYLFSLLAAVALVIAASLSDAQTRGRAVKANIPFDFNAGNKHYSAGQYRVNAVSDLALAILGQGSESGFVFSRRAESSSPSATTKLIFHQYGTSYFLYQIWVQGENSGRELPMTRVEKELARNAIASPAVVVAQK
jgi:hypothetical protein